MKKIITIFILLAFVHIAKAHEGHARFAVDPGVLPGEVGYSFDRLGEWIDVNLLTLSTKKKEGKKLLFSNERVAEIARLAELKNAKTKALKLSGNRYESVIADTEYMAEKIIVLDGNEIELAQEFEEATRLHEQVLANLLEGASAENRAIILEALNFSRIENEQIYKFMVKNYQASDADIEKYRQIVSEHIDFVKDFEVKNSVQEKKISTYLEEAEKFQKAGLNIEAYDFVKKAKNLIYSRLISWFYFSKNYAIA